YNLAVIRYKAVLGNYLTVLTAQTQQLVQDRLDTDLKARAFELDVNLARALGGGYADPAPVNVSAASPAGAARLAAHREKRIRMDQPPKTNGPRKKERKRMLLIAGS